MVSQRFRLITPGVLLAIPLLILLLRLTMFGYSWSAIEPSRTFDAQTGWVHESLRGGSRVTIELVSPPGTILERPVVVASGTIKTERGEPRHIHVAIRLDHLDVMHPIDLSFRAIGSPKAKGGLDPVQRTA